jgi:DNA-binding NarL/FixJ family response regulator
MDRGPIRVLLVEDSDVYRDSLVFLLGRDDDVEVVGAVGDGMSAVQAAEELRPDVVVIDYRLPDRDGGEVASDIRMRAPAPAIVFLSASAGRDERGAAELMDAPLVRKDQGVEELIASLRRVARKDRP